MKKIKIEDEGEIQIDPNDLIIITDKENWKPSQEYILAYAEQLGFDIENDPPELLQIAEKYLTAEIPEEYCRAFHKADLTLIYINVITKDIEVESEIEETAKLEYQEAKEKLRNQENQVKVIPRKKIAPIGSKKAFKDPKIEKEKEFLKKMEQNYDDNKKEKKNKKENKKDKNQNRISDEIKKSGKKSKHDNDEEDEYNFSEKDIDINDQSNKININNKEQEKNVLDLKESNPMVKYFDDDSSSGQEDKSIKPIPSKKNINLKKEKSVENMKVSNEIENPGTIEINKYNSITQKYQRSNKKHHNLRYERRSLEIMKNDNIFKKLEEGNVKETSNDENNNKNEKNKSIKLSISNKSLNTTDLEDKKNNYKEKIKNDYKTIKNNFKANYIKNKKEFVEDFINDLGDKNNKILKELKEEHLQKISAYENELKYKMNRILENYKNNLINEYEEKSDDIENEDDDNVNKRKNYELQSKKLKSEISIQKEKNQMKKELLEQKEKNKLNEQLMSLNQNHKSKKIDMEKNLKNKINILEKEYNTNFIKYQKEYQIRNKDNLSINSNLEEENNRLKEESIQYEREIREQFEENMNSLKNEYDIKLNKELEEFKENINDQIEGKKVIKENKQLEKEYFNDLNQFKENNKYQIKKIEDTIKNLFDKTSNSFDKIKNKSNNDINLLISDILKKITEILNSQNNEENKEILISDCLSELIAKKMLILNKFNSYVEMSEEEYKQTTILIEYFIDIIRMINEIITENIQKSINLGMNIDELNEYLINEILKKINALMEEYKSKYDNEQSERLFPLLNNTIQKLMDLKFDEENNYNIPYNSPRFKAMINSNQNISNMNYLNNMNNSLMNDSNYNSNNFNTNRTINNFNPKLANNSENSSININNNFLNSNQMNSPRKMQINNSTLYYNPLTQRNNYPLNQNKTLNPSSPRINNHIFSIKEDIESNLTSMNLNYINIPQIPNELLNNFSPENLRNYKVIINFLENEYQKILDEQNTYLNRNNINQKLNILKESGKYIKYNNIFEQISKEENDKNNQYLKDIDSKKSVLELIKNNCQESFDFITKYYKNSNIVNNKLGVLINHIEDYNNHFYSRKYNILNSYSKINNIKNAFNNTFQIQRNNYNQSNFLNNTFSNNYEHEHNKFYNSYNSFKYH